MRILTILLSSWFAAVQLYAQRETADSSFHLYLLIGQSNMAGRGQIDEESKQVDENIFVLDSQNHWKPATDPLHFDKSVAGVGPGLSFAKNMLNTKIKVGLIPCAWGGSPIKVWQPGEKYFAALPYDDALVRVKIAMQTGVLKGILWHQGESDNDSAKALVYLKKLQTLVNRFRTDLQIPDLPFVAGEIGYFNKVDFINKEIDKLPQVVANTAVVSAEGLVDKGDKLHFNTSSAREMGKRYAAAMFKLQRKDDQLLPVVVLSFDDAEISHYTIVAPLLKKYGFNATFFVCEMPFKSPGDSVYYMKWQQIKALHEMGFEIGNHTGHHKNMTKLTRVEMQKEITYIETKCKEYGIPKPVSFAYPGNRSDSLSQVVLHEMGYRHARAGGSKYFSASADPHLSMSSFTMGSSEKLRERTWMALKNLQPGQILIFTIHGVPDIAHPDYSTSEEMFIQFLEYMKEHRFNVIAVKDMQQFIH